MPPSPSAAMAKRSAERRSWAILTLGAGIGTTIVVTASGLEAAAALDAITTLVANRFGEDE